MNRSPRSNPQKRRSSPRSQSSSSENPTILFDQGWRRLEVELLEPLAQAIKASRGDRVAVKRLFGSSQFTSLYTHIYTMCTQKAPHNWSGKLYFEYRRDLCEHLKKNVLPVIQQVASRGSYNDPSNDRDSIQLLTVVDQMWKNHCLYVTWSCKFFHYLDRFYVKRLAVDELKTVTLKCFKEEVYDHIQENVTSAYVHLVSHERSAAKSSVAHDSMLERLTKMYLALGRGTTRVYEKDLEKSILESARTDMSRDASNWVNRETTAVYMLKAEERLSDERYRATAFLHPSSDAKLQKVCEEELLGSIKIQTVVLSHTVSLSGETSQKDDGSFDTLLRGTKRRDLKRMYGLFARVPGGLEAMCTAFRDHVNRVGAELVRSTKDAKGLSTLIVRLSLLHDKYDENVVDDCFKNDVLFREGMRTAFESAANIQPTVGRLKMAELVADLFDRELHKAGRGMSARVDPNTFSMETALNKASQMFSYLRDKDVFVDAYRKQLAKRLLTMRSRDGGQAESDSIAMLKERMGAAFTAKLEGMMNDVSQNEVRTTEFQAYLLRPEEIVRQSRAGALHDEMGENVLSPAKKGKGGEKLDFSPSRPPSIGYDLRVQLLTNGHWPTTKTLSFDVPHPMRKAQAVFERFYMVVTANRKLRWAHALGTVVVVGSGWSGGGGSVEMVRY